MNTNREKLRSNLRIVWAIGSKDIVDALKNKTILANIIMVLFLMMFYKWLPGLSLRDETHVVVYDAGRSRLLSELENDLRFQLYEAASVQELERKISEGDNGELGLVVPADFEQVLGSGGQPELDAYVLWSERSSATDLRLDLEEQLNELLGQRVSINVEGSVHNSPDSMGPVRTVSITLVVVIFFISLLTVPHLMFEEKQTRTIDVLLVSPASISQVVMGKALAGAFYCLTAAGVALALNQVYVANWGLALLAVLSGALFSVGMGLVLGTFLDTLQQMRSWGFIPMAVLMIPAFLSVVDPILPPPIRNALHWVPTVALVILFRYACSSGATLAQVAFHLGIVLGGALLALALVLHKVRRSDR